MKITKLIFTIFIIISISKIAYNEEIVRITNGEWPPYLSEKLKHYGVASHIVTEAFALEGVKVQYGFFPWSRAFDLAEKGEWDGSAIWTWSKEREKEFYISDPVVESGYVFFHLKNLPFDWNNIEDLKGYKIGGTLEYNYGEPFENAEKKGIINVIRIPKDELNFAKLLGKRIDIFPMTLDVGYTILHENYTPEVVSTVTNHLKPLRVDPLHLLLSKKIPKNKELIILFNNGLKKLREIGKLDEYLDASRRGEYKP
ncbi:MAG: transporter substrate-binding domain-containing protein [Desulfobacterales bacterium]|nr:transporter substrate-binding domain-containing protein [Desulfobacterales bacterium]